MLAFGLVNSWWSLGEHSGYRGQELSLHRITCPFCNESGNFKVVAHAEKKKPNGPKRLNFDTLECGSCKGYVLCLWSGGSSGYHDFRVLPEARRLERHPEHWPADVGRFWVQAHRSLADDNWDAAAVMARSALQAALRQHEAKGANLKQEIADLAARGLLPPLMKDWADTLRELGNDSAHPKPGQPATSSKDASDVTQFLDFLLEYLYSLPHQIQEYRTRSEKQ
jgi:hypothetical protein